MAVSSICRQGRSTLQIHSYTIEEKRPIRRNEYRHGNNHQLVCKNNNNTAWRLFYNCFLTSTSTFVFLFFLRISHFIELRNEILPILWDLYKWFVVQSICVLSTFLRNQFFYAYCHSIRKMSGLWHVLH